MVNQHIIGLSKFYLFGFAFMAFSFYGCWNPYNVTQTYPQLFFSSHLNTTLKSELPPLPENMEACWKLAKINYQYNKLEKNDLKKKTLINEAAAILGKKVLSEEKFNIIYKTIVDSENEESTLQKIMQFFSFVNIIWFLGAVGMCLFIIPFLACILEPLKILIRTVFLNAIRAINDLGGFTILGFLICSQFIAEGFRYNIDSGFYIALLGILGSAAMTNYSHINHIRNNNLGDLFWSSVYMLQGVIFLPFSVYYQSSFLAWATTILFYISLSISFFPGIFEFIFFNREDEIITKAVAPSMVLSVFFFALKFLKIRNAFIDVYQTPLTALSSFMMFFVMNIYASESYDYYATKIRYYKRQALMVSILSIYLFLGFLFSIDGLINISVFYAAVYLMCKVTEVLVRVNTAISIIILLISLVGYCFSLYLHSHKDFITSIFGILES